jgi:CubicO group peptidase (beta-lactamase class C family)
VRLTLVATGLLVCLGCSHAPPPTETKKVEQHDDWILALKSDLELTASNDGFEGQVRVMHGGKPEVDRSFGDTSCLGLGSGRRLLATVAVGVLVQQGKMGWDDWVERRLPSAAGTSFSALTVGNLLTDSAGMAMPKDLGVPDTDLERLVDASAKVPLRVPPGTLIDPADERPWVLVERIVTQVSGQPFAQFVQEHVLAPAGMSGTSVAAKPACPGGDRGTTTLEDQFRFIEALRSGKLVSPEIRAAMWQPRLPLGVGSEAAYGFFIRTRENQQAVGISGEGVSPPAYELWLDPNGPDALVLLGRTAPKTARGIRTALGEFYALPPGRPQSSAPARKSVAR